MFLTEYDEEEILKQERQEGFQKGAFEEKTRTVIEMLKENLPIDLIQKISKLSEDVIRGIAMNLGLSVVN